MKNSNFKYGIILLYIIIFVFFYYYPIQIKTVNNIFLTISTFLFTIFTGFFISRQGSRYTKIREIVANFDGEMSALYRYAGYFSKDFSEKIGSIIKKHYQTILDHNAWDYHFVNKSETITNIHEVMQNSLKDQNLPSLTNQAVTNIFRSLGNLQMLRKQMIMLHQEHIPKFEITYKPDFRQAIADSWPMSIDDSVARKDWGLQCKYDLKKMTEVMINEIKKKIQK